MFMGIDNKQALDRRAIFCPAKHQICRCRKQGKVNFRKF